MARIHAGRSLRIFGAHRRRSVRWAVAGAACILVGSCGKDAPFTPPPPPPACAYSLSTASVAFGVDGGSQQITVSTPGHCAWTASTDAAWLSITSGTSGTGTGTVTIAATANPTTAERECLLVIAEQPVTVRQARLAACSYGISPESASAGSSGATGTIQVTAPEHCTWHAVSHAAWLAVTSGESGAGSGTVDYRADPNGGPSGRQGTIDVAGLTFTLVQDGDVESCRYGVEPVTFEPCMTSGDLTAAVTTEPGCPWTATPDASWLTVVEGETGEGPGTVRFRVSDNWAPPRASVVKIRWPAPTLGQNLQIAQAGCYYAVSHTSIAFAAAGGPGSVNVYQQSDPITCGGPLQDRCLWTASANVPWITITSSLPRAGDNPLAFTVAPNDGPFRSGTITIRDKAVRIDQAGR